MNSHHIMLTEIELSLLRNKLTADEDQKYKYDEALEATRKLKDLLYEIQAIKAFRSTIVTAERITNMGL